MNEDIGFYYEEGTTVAFGCGATLMGEFYYFGGYESNKRQVWLIHNIYLLLFLLRRLKFKIVC